MPRKSTLCDVMRRVSLLARRRIGATAPGLFGAAVVFGVGAWLLWPPPSTPRRPELADVDARVASAFERIPLAPPLGAGNRPAANPIASAPFDPEIGAPTCVEGRVVDRDGRPVSNVRVEARRRRSRDASVVAPSNPDVSASSIVASPTVQGDLASFGSAYGANYPLHASAVAAAFASPRRTLDGVGGDSFSASFEGGNEGADRVDAFGWVGTAPATSIYPASPVSYADAVAVARASGSSPLFGAFEAPATVPDLASRDPDYAPDAEAFAITDAEGRFAIRAHLCDGAAYALYATGPCLVAEALVPFEFGATDALVRVRRFAALEATFEIGGRPIDPSRVRLRVVDGACAPWRAFHKGEGVHRAEGLAAGEAIVEVFVDGGREPAAKAESVVLKTGETTRDPRLLPLRLDGYSKTIRVRVVDDVGRPIAGAAVRKASEEASVMVLLDCRAAGRDWGSLGASGATTDSEGAATLAIPVRGEALSIAANGFVPATLVDVRGDVVARLTRYRTLDVGWSDEWRLETASCDAVGAALRYEVVVEFSPNGGGPPWNAVHSSATPVRFYCESAGRMRFLMRVYATADGLQSFSEPVEWRAEAVVSDDPALRAAKLAPPTKHDLVAVAETLAARVASARARKAAEDELLRAVQSSR
jgi:hypothetical protein